jgi:hypothetical protein
MARVSRSADTARRVRENVGVPDYEQKLSPF